MLACATIAANGMSAVSLLTAICVEAITVLPKKNKKETLAKNQSQSVPKADHKETLTKNEEPLIEKEKQVIAEYDHSTFRLYRQGEFNRIVASLLANASILVAGEQGSGKSVLASAVVEKLRDDGFNVAFVEPATTKQMLLEICEQLGIETQNLEGKSLTAEQLKRRIENSLKENVAFLIVDDCQNCDSRFRHWLKQLKRLRVPILLLATNPPRTDVFFSMPPLILTPLPEDAIRTVMEQAALERGLNLKNSDFARLQQRAGGNPMLAQRVIDEEYLGLEVESADHNHYMDITPLVLLAGVGFMVLRFVGLGTNNRNLYIVSGIGAAVFLGVSRLLYNLPQESRRIQS